MTYSFFCPCVPPKATAQQKGARVVGDADASGAIRNAKVRVHTKRHVEKAKALFTALFVDHRPPCPFNGPLRVQIVLTFPWNKGETKANRAKGWLPMPVGPDFDNLSKTPVDVLSRLSFWCNDSQIFDGRIIKGWGGEPGVRVRIEEVDGEDFSHMIGKGDGE